MRLKKAWFSTLMASVSLYAVATTSAQGQDAEGCAIANALDAAALIPDGIVGAGPFGEEPSTVDSVHLTDEQGEAVEGCRLPGGRCDADHGY